MEIVRALLDKAGSSARFTSLLSNLPVIVELLLATGLPDSSSSSSGVEQPPTPLCCAVPSQLFLRALRRFLSSEEDTFIGGGGGGGGGGSGGSRGDKEALPLASPPFTLHSLATPSSVEGGGEGAGILLLPSDLPKKFSGGGGGEGGARLKGSAAPPASVTSVMMAIQGALELCGMGSSSGLNNT
jgi:hypothetical protein